MRSWIFLSALLLPLPATAARQATLGIAPASISIPAPIGKRHNPHLSLGVPHHAWILVEATVTGNPDGGVIDFDLRPVAVAGLDGLRGTFARSGDTLVPDDAAQFGQAARAALESARFEKPEDGQPWRSVVKLAWKAYGGSMQVEAAESGGCLRYAPDVLASTTPEGTTFYLWRGVDAAIEAERFETVDDGNRLDLLGLPSVPFVEELAPDCGVLETTPGGTWSQNLDDGLHPLRPIRPEYPERERRDRRNGTVVLVIQVARDGTVAAVHPAHTVPGHPAFAESAVRAACRLEYGRPRLNGEAVVGLALQNVEFTIEGP